jgi:hypothetical protein
LLLVKPVALKTFRSIPIDYLLFYMKAETLVFLDAGLEFKLFFSYDPPLSNDVDLIDRRVGRGFSGFESVISFNL